MHLQYVFCDSDACMHYNEIDMRSLDECGTRFSPDDRQDT